MFIRSHHHCRYSCIYGQGHIARILTAAKSLRTVRLNLDFHDDHQACCSNQEKRKKWHETFFGERGPEIVDILQDCPLLEYVSLLYHGERSSVWVEFHPPRCAEPRVVFDYDKRGSIDASTRIHSIRAANAFRSYNLLLIHHPTCIERVPFEVLTDGNLQVLAVRGALPRSTFFWGSVGQSP